MAIDLDTFLVALYTIVDDLYQQHAAPAKPRRRRGRRRPWRTARCCPERCAPNGGGPPSGPFCGM